MTKRFNFDVDWTSFQFCIGISKLSLNPDWKYVISFDFGFIYTYVYLYKRTKTIKTTNHD